MAYNYSYDPYGGYGGDLFGDYGPPPRARQQVVNKRARKTIQKAIRFYKQLRKLEKGIQKMAGKAHLRRDAPQRRRHFRRR